MKYVFYLFFLLFIRLTIELVPTKRVQNRELSFFFCSLRSVLYINNHKYEKNLCSYVSVLNGYVRNGTGGKCGTVSR